MSCATDYIVKPARLEALVAVAQDIRQRWIA
jgi:DNA-binding response OmpR family regulator